MVRLGLIAALAILAVPMATRAVADQGRAEQASSFSSDVVELAPQDSPFSLLQIDNAWGDVSVEGYEGATILVETRKQIAKDGAVGKMEIMSGADGVVAIRTSMPAPSPAALERGAGLERRPRIDVRVRVPRNVAVKAQIKSGLLRARDLPRGAALYANAGAIQVERIAGALLVDSTFAVPTVREVVGNVDIDVLRANLSLDDISGDRLDAGVHEGNIFATHVRSRRIALRVFRGDVELDAQGIAKGDIRVSVNDGDILVRMAPRGDVSLRARAASVILPGGGTLNKDSWHFGGAGGATAVTLVAGSSGRVTFALP